MAFSVLTSLSLAFMVAGLTLLITALTLSHRARRYQRGMQALLQLSGSSVEILELPATAWPILQEAGWRSLHWEGDWYGQSVSGTLGEAPAQVVVSAEPLQSFEVNGNSETALRITLRHSAPRGERRLFANHLAQVFILLLETRLRERTAALSAALAERARLSLYLQHDMRNLAQWVGWVGTDLLEANTPEALNRVAHRLQSNAPVVLQRATRLIAALGKASPANIPCAIDLRQALEQAARLAGVEVFITGDATAWIAPELLERALDNLLGNLAKDWREGLTHGPSAVITPPPAQGHTPHPIRVVLACPLPPEGLALAPEKLFEPFASGRPGGMGLGLYQARHCLRTAGGELHASVMNQELQFTLEFRPKLDEKTTPAPAPTPV